MRLEVESLFRYLAARLVTIQTSSSDEDRRVLEERVFKDILRYPKEGWSPEFFSADHQSNMCEEFQMLDPAMVLGRMFCAQVEYEMEYYLSDEDGGALGVKPNLPWLLRCIADEEWKVSEVFALIKNRSPENGVLRKMVPGISRYFHLLFDDDDDEGDLVRNLRDASTRLENGTLMHVSAPKFHHNWENMIGKGDGEDAALLGKREQAKQQWSMIIGHELEWMCEELKGATVLQSGGGHVLLLLDEGELSRNEQMKERADEILKRISAGWRKSRGWSPKLWASWEEGGVEREWEKDKERIGKPVTSESILKEIYDEHERYRFVREMAVSRWAIFGHGYEPESDDDPHTLYLDVIGLGEKCWGKKDAHDNEVKYMCQNIDCKDPISTEDFYDTECESCKGEYACVPTRSRERTIEGFRQSRVMTALIESTFGRIISAHNPREILSMGGDEMIAKIDPGSWGGIVEEVEKHCNIMHGSLMAEIEPQALWWAMNGPPGAKVDYSGFKDTLRTINKHWGMRFVEPMFTNLRDEH